MSRRTRPVRGLDQADLVLVAAEVLGADPDEVLDRADVAVLSGIASRVRVMVDVAEAAAEVLVGIAAGRPFEGSDRAVAWLAAVVLVERNGQTVGGDDGEWVALVDAAATGAAGERDVAAVLAPHLHADGAPPRGALGRWFAAALAPRAEPLPTAHTCPACGGEVRREALWLFPAWAVPTPLEVTAACHRLRGTHARDGSSAPVEDPPPPWRPVVTGPGAAGRPAFVALTEAGPLAFLPTAGDDLDAGDRSDGGYDVIGVDDLAPSDLVGSWDGRWRGARVVAHVPAAAVVLDDTGTQVDWAQLVGAVPELGLVSA